ncbi:MAG TPA: metallophosphoesterase [Anaerolineales bacterium]|nr:metallophosphoesterase [Anaerolineales bacterium]
MSFALLAATFACARQPAPVAIATPTVTILSPEPATVEPISTSEPATSSPTTTATPVPTPAVLLAVGDAASCSTTGDDAVAALIESRPGTVAVIGDTVYDRGRPNEYAQCYDPIWGRFKDRTRPAVGNHEYLTAGASGYFDYFGAVAGDSGAGYYSYDLGAWHMVVINSVCWEVGGCGRNDPQAEWLKADLAAHPGLCTLAYWHFPRFSSGHHGSMAEVDAYWDILYEAGAEVVLTGHDHDYERFAPQDGDGRADPERGLREFVVGTGGFSRYSFPGSPLGTSEVRDSSSFGILVLTLFEDHYEWEFVPIPGDTFVDSGSGACHP